MKTRISHFSLFSSTVLLISMIMMFTTGCGKKDITVTDQLLLSGKFSVAEGKQVRFTKGNLYWDGTAYHLESSQTAYAGPSVGTTYNASHVGHFFWASKADCQSGTAAYMPYTAEYSFSNGQDDDKRTVNDKFFCGEDSKMTVDGQSGLFALTCGTDGEWNYLFSARANASSLYKKHVTVNGVSECIVIAPDDFTGTLADSYDASAWKTAETSGIVCLPPAGYRNGNVLHNQGSCGGYLSATPSSSDVNLAYGVYFPDPSFFPTDCERRSYGYSVRLVSSVSN